MKGSGESGTETLFYDGECGLCHGAVRFVLKADRAGALFRFAPLQGSTFRSLVPDPERTALPDSLVVRTEDGRLLTRSSGVLHMMRRLGGPWRAVAVVAGVFPRPLRDWVYDVVARVRHRLFARPGDACPVTPPELRARFDP